MNKIIVKNKKELQKLIKKEINLHGYEVNLNHIDISQVSDLSELFSESKFNGDISQWDVSNVKSMEGMFYSSSFNGDISGWNVSNVENMIALFSFSKFNQDLSSWTPFSLDNSSFIFGSNHLPYWANCHTNEEIREKIEVYQIKKEKQTIEKNCSITHLIEKEKSKIKL
jgi:surface protein